MAENKKKNSTKELQLHLKKRKIAPFNNNK